MYNAINDTNCNPDWYAKCLLCMYDPEGANKETLWELNIQCDVHKRPNNVHEPRISYEEES